MDGSGTYLWWQRLWQGLAALVRSSCRLYQSHAAAGTIANVVRIVQEQGIRGAINEAKTLMSLRARRVAMPARATMGGQPRGGTAGVGKVVDL